MDQLREALGTIPQGKLVEADARKIEAALSGCWDDLAAHEGGMKAGKLIGRTEEMEWNPPLSILARTASVNRRFIELSQVCRS